MKKLLMVSIMVFLSSIAFAQDVDLPEEGVGLESGDLLIEITSSPFGRDGISYISESGTNLTLLNFGQLRARFAVTDRIVPRLGVWFSIDDNHSRISTPDVTESVTEFMIAPGAEYHFINENGFTSYAAFDVLISGRSMQRESSTGSDVSGTLSVPSGTNQDFSLSNRGYFGIGAHGAVGADYHFSSRFYIGAEIGLYIMAGTSSDIEVDGTLYQEGIKFFDAGVKTSNSFRIGFKLL